MQPHWILVANASRARLLSRTSPTGPLAALFTLRHVQPRHPDVDREHEHFAREIVRYLHAQAVSGDFGSLSIFAPSPFLHELKRQLSPAIRQTVRLALDADLSDLSPFEMERHIPEPRPIISLRHLRV